MPLLVLIFFLTFLLHILFKVFVTKPVAISIFFLLPLPVSHSGEMMNTKKKLWRVRDVNSKKRTIKNAIKNNNETNSQLEKKSGKYSHCVLDLHTQCKLLAVKKFDELQNSREIKTMNTNQKKVSHHGFANLDTNKVTKRIERNEQRSRNTKKKNAAASSTEQRTIFFLFWTYAIQIKC